MSYERWLNYIESADKIAFIVGKTRKVSYKFFDGAEMIEEYNTETGILIRRAWKSRHDVLCSTSWYESLFNSEIELGDNISATEDSQMLLKESHPMVVITYFQRIHCIL